MDRRASYDDARGMGEGILDNRDTQHRYWLLLEAKTAKTFEEDTQIPTQLANLMSRRLNHPPVQFVCSQSNSKDLLVNKVALLSKPMPIDLHLFNLRSLNNPKPSNSALLMLHKQGKSCQFSTEKSPHREIVEFDSKEVKIDKFQSTSLTGNSLKQTTVLNNVTSSRLEDMRLHTFRIDLL